MKVQGENGGRVSECGWGTKAALGCFSKAELFVLRYKDPIRSSWFKHCACLLHFYVVIMLTQRLNT